MSRNRRQTASSTQTPAEPSKGPSPLKALWWVLSFVGAVAGAYALFGGFHDIQHGARQRALVERIPHPATVEGRLKNDPAVERTAAALEY